MLNIFLFMKVFFESLSIYEKFKLILKPPGFKNIEEVELDRFKMNQTTPISSFILVLLFVQWDPHFQILESRKCIKESSCQ